MPRKLAKIRTYYKYELADLYNMTRRNFMMWMEDNNMIDDLERMGYTINQQIFSVKQVEYIFDFLGHPEALNNTDVHTFKKVAVTTYTKGELAELYGVSIRTLLTQIDNSMEFKVRCLIMDKNIDRNVHRMSADKKRFKADEVALIFEYLGRPYV